ncbi:MAG: hypothetical protein A4E63_01427 [Syntrophorhabdus sp. PtaU1.Bin050]|nr:MAG: hypothetical protein A4E63_01427 [Syntrophorhabdus sp. PtaU1.Bin050]
MTGQVGSLASKRNSRRNAISIQVHICLREAPLALFVGGDDVSPGMKRSIAYIARSRARRGGSAGFAGGGDDVSPGNSRDGVPGCRAFIRRKRSSIILILCTHFSCNFWQYRSCRQFAGFALAFPLCLKKTKSTSHLIGRYPEPQSLSSSEHPRASAKFQK